MTTTQCIQIELNDIDSTEASYPPQISCAALLNIAETQKATAKQYHDLASKLRVAGFAMQADSVMHASQQEQSISHLFTDVANDVLDKAFRSVERVL